MIAWDSTEWHWLAHAYGRATDIPGLLKQLASATGPATSAASEPWHTLWSALCHQDDVYTASYAAVPHIVTIGLNAQGPIAFDFFGLPACIEVARARERGPALEEPLEAPYRAALSQLHDLAHRQSRWPWDQYMTRSVAGALAAAKGQVDLAEALIELDDDWIRRIVQGER